MPTKGLEKTLIETIVYKLQCFWLRLQGCKPFISGYSASQSYKIGDRVEPIGVVRNIVFCGRWTFDQEKYPNVQPVPHYQVWIK